MARIAALDLGSNSFHLLVAEARSGERLQRVATKKIRLRLGEPLARTGSLGEDARRRAREAVDQLLGEARSHGADRVVTVATEALRAAHDGPRLRAALEQDHGLAVQLLSGDDEAALSLRAMATALRIPEVEPVVGADLGGGSYDLALGDGARTVATASLPLGAARIAGRLHYDPPRLSERVVLYREVCAALRPFAAEVGRRLDGRRARAVATAGTIRDLGRLGLAMAGGAPPQKVRGLSVTRDQLERAYARLVSVATPERAELPGVSAKRADLLPAGGIVLLATLDALDLPQLQLCDWGLREGALLDVLAGGEHLDVAAVTRLR